MAIIDYHSIKSLTYAKLKKCSRILIPILSCLCDDWDGSLSPEHSKHHILAMYAGLSISSIQRALKELHEKDIITIQTTTGHPASLHYLPQLKLSAKSQKALLQLPMSHGHTTAEAAYQVGHSDRATQPQVGHSDRASMEKTPPQTPTPVSKKQPGTILPLNNSPKSLKNKQTALVPRSLIRTWWPIKGPKFVMSVLREMEKKNGEVKDPAAYFATCCKNNWVPTSRKAEKEAAAEAAREERTLYEESERQRWERVRQSVITEQADPDAQERIKAIQDNFLQTMGEPEVVHNPPP